ncbi:MAG TPA: TIM barrel protein [Burkholderiales bacterium]|nr:TIM barrel protein [Burkholderiales bacterium]
MPRLAANVSMLFKERPFPERFDAAAQAGFRAVEYQYPYEWGPEQVAACARDAGVEVVLHNMPPGPAGYSGTACIPGAEGRFREDLEKAIQYAGAVCCPRIHCVAGVMPPGVPVAHLRETFVANLRHAARRLGEEGMTAMIEPLSAGTVAGCFLTGSRQAVELIAEIGAPNVKLQYDIFHMQAMEGDLARTIERLLPSIGHLQLADLPGRHEPGSGEINFDFLLAHIDRLGYGGWIGCEYNPSGDTVEGLKWAQPYLRSASG